MCQNINMNPYKGFYVNECLGTLLEFHLSLKYSVILLKQAKQSIHAKLHQLTRKNKATYWMKGVFTFHIFVLFI